MHFFGHAFIKIQKEQEAKLDQTDNHLDQKTKWWREVSMRTNAGITLLDWEKIYMARFEKDARLTK